MSDFKAIIPAGGSGERFWPLSTPERPKQFLSVFGNESLIRQSVSRLKGLVKPKDVYVITAKALVGVTRKELPEIPKANVIGEPMRRDTGAAVALGVGVAGKGVLGFFPADQIAANPAGFRKAVSAAIARAKKTDAIVTIGIKPTFPATGFGYVNPQSGQFVEKPDEKKPRTPLPATPTPSAIAAPVSRRIGSPMMFAFGISGSSLRVAATSAFDVITKTSFGFTRPLSRLTLWRIRLSPPKTRRNCFGFSGVERGQNRSPEPPARMIALKSDI